MDAIEKCPSCGEVMERGFLISPRGITWWPDKPLPKLSCLGESITPSADWHFTSCSYISAYWCRICRIILVTYPEKEGEKPEEKKRKKEEAEKLYNQLLDQYRSKGEEQVLEDKIRHLVTAGYSRDEAIYSIARIKGLAE